MADGSHTGPERFGFLIPEGASRPQPADEARQEHEPGARRPGRKFGSFSGTAKEQAMRRRGEGGEKPRVQFDRSQKTPSRELILTGADQTSVIRVRSRWRTARAPAHPTC